MDILNEIEKYKLNPEDWENMPLVELKMKAQNIISLFAVIDNTLAPHISPSESELMYNTKKEVTKYLDNIISQTKRE